MLKRTIIFRPAWDRRDPDPAINYGIHGVELLFLLQGDKGAVQFMLFTNWFLPQNRQDQFGEVKRVLSEPMPADLGYHSIEPHYPDQAAMDCQYLPSGKCYYDGSGLNAISAFEVLVAGGDKALWSCLEEYYQVTFDSLEKLEPQCRPQ